MSLITRLADAIAASIFAGYSGQHVEVLRSWDAREKLQDLGDKWRITIIPQARKYTADTRECDVAEKAVVVAFEKRVSADAVPMIDECDAFVEANIDRLRQIELPGLPEAEFVEISNEPLLNWKKLADDQVFESALLVKFNLPVELEPS